MIAPQLESWPLIGALQQDVHAIVVGRDRQDVVLSGKITFAV
jgi:hypothetical protein